VLKPACLGSSVGIVIAHNEEEFIEGVEEAGTFDFKIVVEKMVDNLREINCSVLGSCFSAKASVLEEVGKNDEILSYKDKYQGGG
ncbi:MAG: D-alanine--D-alanine ligase, partial [Anaerorhabdus sp.]